MNLDILKRRAKAFDYLFDAVVVTDLQGIIIDWNSGSEILYGYSKEEAIGQPVCMLHVPDDTKLITTRVISAVQKHGKWSGEIRMLRKNGTIGWIESICIPIYDKNNQIMGAIGINRDITARKVESERLEYLAHYDHLTQIPNRYLLLDRVKHLIAQSERDNRSFSILFIDIDNFKIINDTKGHAFGDEVLVKVASRLKQSIRNSDTVARFGGDEFVLLLERMSNTNDASRIIEIIVKALNEEFVINKERMLISCSIGVAVYPDDGTTSDALLVAADKAMYKAKRR